MFSDFCFQVTDLECLIIVSHSYFVSIFDINRQKFIRHHKYESEVKEMFKSYNNRQIQIGVLLQNGKIFLYEDIDEDKDSEDVVKLKVEGELIKVYRDQESFRAFFIQHIVNDKSIISGVRNN